MQRICAKIGNSSKGNELLPFDNNTKLMMGVCMLEYEKQLPNGLWIAKRGYCYFLYSSITEITNDDCAVDRNLERIRNGEDVFNRCINGSWLFYSRKMAETIEHAETFQQAK